MGDNEEAREARAPIPQNGMISPKLSILLIGGAAIGLIVLMCLTVLIIIAVKT